MTALYIGKAVWPRGRRPKASREGTPVGRRAMLISLQRLERSQVTCAARQQFGRLGLTLYRVVRDDRRTIASTFLPQLLVRHNPYDRVGAFTLFLPELSNRLSIGCSRSWTLLHLVASGDMRRHRGCAHTLAEIDHLTIPSCFGQASLIRSPRKSP
jgi:hypothetical protein